ncbi:MAG TPA: hypothetical protein VIY48_00540 [Candidatus Paceibacterota bacterium]
MRSTVSKRGVRGGKRVDTAQLKDWLSKGEIVTSLGVVRKFEDQSSHFEVSAENGSREILVDVELVPSGSRVTCRLGFGGNGVYKIPPVDTEVAVLIPFDPQSLVKDSLDFEPIIVGTLDVNAPTQLDNDDIVVISSARVHVYSDNILLGTSPGAQEGILNGTAIDPFTGATHFALGNASLKVKASK